MVCIRLFSANDSQLFHSLKVLLISRKSFRYMGMFIFRYILHNIIDGEDSNVDLFKIEGWYFNVTYYI